jgi:predicted dehydrogenase
MARWAVVPRVSQRLPQMSPTTPYFRGRRREERRRFLLRGACHTFDFLDSVRPIVDVRDRREPGGAWAPEDIVAATRFDSGIVGTGLWCYAADHDHEMNEIVGSTGRIRFSTSQPAPIQLLRGSAVEEYPVGDPPHVHQPLIQSIVDELNGQGRCPSTGETAARTARVMDEVLITPTLI